MPTALTPAVSLLSRHCSPRGKRVIEYGTGSGRATTWIVSQGPLSYHGFDSCREMLSLATSRHVAQGHTLLQHDLLSPWPFPQGSADLVVGTQVLSHVAEDGLVRFFRNALWVLGGGGGGGVCPGGEGGRGICLVERLAVEDGGDEDDYYQPHSEEVLRGALREAEGLLGAEGSSAVFCDVSSTLSDEHIVLKIGVRGP